LLNWTTIAINSNIRRILRELCVYFLRGLCGFGCYCNYLFYKNWKIKALIPKPTINPSSLMWAQRTTHFEYQFHPTKKAHSKRFIPLNSKSLIPHYSSLIFGVCRSTFYPPNRISYGGTGSSAATPLPRRTKGFPLQPLTQCSASGNIHLQKPITTAFHINSSTLNPIELYLRM